MPLLARRTRSPSTRRRPRRLHLTRRSSSTITTCSVPRRPASLSISTRIAPHLRTSDLLRVQATLIRTPSSPETLGARGKRNSNCNNVANRATTWHATASHPDDTSRPELVVPAIVFTCVYRSYFSPRALKRRVQNSAMHSIDGRHHPNHCNMSFA